MHLYRVLLALACILAGPEFCLPPCPPADFGLGVFFKPGERFRDLVGSPYYVAPEVRERGDNSRGQVARLLMRDPSNMGRGMRGHNG